jgi:hypothetical protein
MSKYKKFWVGGALNTAMGLGTAIYGGVKEQQAKRKMAQAEELAAGPIRSQAARQRTARQEGDAQASTDAALRAEATAAAQIAETGGSRSLMAASPSLQRSTQQAVLAGLDRFGSLGAQVSALQDTQDLSSINQRLGSDLSRLQGAADAGRAALYGGIGQAIGGVAQIAGSLPKKEERGINQVKTGGFLTSKAMGAMSTPARKAPTLSVQPSLANFESPMAQTSIAPAKPGVDLQPISGMIQKQAPLLGDPYANDKLSAAMRMLNEDPFKTRSSHLENGGKINDDVDETPGEFNHDANPIDIIQEGEKIGEMTGGEYIFNPEQAEELRALSQEGDSDLHIFIRNLLSKEEFQE